MLEELEHESLQELDFIELNACAGGCVGGIFAAENGYVARARIKRLRKYLPVSCNRLGDSVGIKSLFWTEPLEFAPVMTLAEKVEDAMRIMDEIEKIAAKLPKLTGLLRRPPAARWPRICQRACTRDRLHIPHAP